MKKVFFCIFLIAVFLSSRPVLAADDDTYGQESSVSSDGGSDYSAVSTAEMMAMSLGASTLPRGNGAVSLSTGLEFPMPVIWGIRFDYGIWDTFQAGVHGSYSGVYLNGGIQGKYNFFLSKNDHHWLSIEAMVDYVHFWKWGNYQSIMFQPKIFYGYRFGQMLSNSFFIGAGTLTAVMKGSESNFLDYFERGDRNGWKWGSSAVGQIGYERALATHWNFCIEGGPVYAFSPKKLSGYGGIHLSWHF